MRAQPDPSRPRGGTVLVLLGVLGGLLFSGFVALGVWQLQRLGWKQELIARVEQRVHAAPVAAPSPREQPRVDAAQDEYRHVYVAGRFLHGHETLVQAVTERGPGFWLITPLRSDTGFIVLVNRGFVDAAHRDPDSRPASQADAPVRVSGLLRLSEPGGGFLRDNDPAARRWYSRDVAAIAAAQQLPAVQLAPYFIDADADAGPDRDGTPEHWPVGGLTVLRFHNSHLVYALTWFALAALTAFAAVLVLRRERLLRAGAAVE